MKLYYSKGACSLAVRILINELNIPCDFEEVNLKTKRTATDSDYLKINPKGSVPALEVEDQIILTENAVIQQYLAEKFNGAQFLPSISDFKRYRVLEWLNFMSADIHKSFGPLFNPNVPDEIKSSIFIPILKSKLKHVNQHLERHKFLIDDEFTLPDTYLFAMLRWLNSFNIHLDEFKNLERYFNEVKQRPAVIQALKDEGLS